MTPRQEFEQRARQQQISLGGFCSHCKAPNRFKGHIVNGQLDALLTAWDKTVAKVIGGDEPDEKGWVRKTGHWHRDIVPPEYHRNELRQEQRERASK